MSSAMISSGLLALASFSSSGISLVGELIFLFVDQDVGVFEDDFHPLLVGDEVGAQVAAVELHALDDVDGGLEALAFFDGDHAVGADLLERVGQLFADRLVVIGGDRGDLGDLFLARDLLGLSLDRARRWRRPPCRFRASAPSGRHRRPGS